MIKKIVWVAIVLIVIAIAYVAVTASTRTTDCCHGEQYLPPTNPALKDWNAYTADTFLFAYPKSLTVAHTGNSFTIGTGTESGYPRFEITEVNSPVAVDSTGKWGEYKIHFDAASKNWIVTRPNKIDGAPYDEPAKTVMTTYGGYPVFAGGTMAHGFGRYTYIVAMSPMHFLIASGQETVDPSTPEKEPLYTLVRSIVGKYQK